MPLVAPWYKSEEWDNYTSLKVHSVSKFVMISFILRKNNDKSYFIG